MEVRFRRSHEGRAGVVADAMRATGRDAGAEKTGIENEAADTKKPTSIFFDRREQTDYRTKRELTEEISVFGKAE